MPEPTTAVMLLRAAVGIVATILLVIASVNDIAVRTIPDSVPAGLVALGIATHLANNDATAALIAASMVFVPASLCWRQGWLGGGDVKLIVGCAWLVSPVQVPTLVLGSALAGGALASVYLCLCWMTRRFHLSTVAAPRRTFAARVWRVERWRISRRDSLPYGCAIATAMLITLYSG
jgi:prepilin peptidase CpaA